MSAIAMDTIRVAVDLPYVDAAKMYRIWAQDENTIDFYKDIKKALRCTLCFAALELTVYLQKLGFVAFVGGGDAEWHIALSCDETEGEAFEIKCDENKILIHGFGRAGILYGVYELLNAQGIRWYSPDEEYVPKENPDLCIPECKKYTYDMPLGRGFDFEGPLKDSAKLFLWMARNRLNYSTLKPNTAKLQQKLCMIAKEGGHIFEAMLSPDNLTSDGKRFFEVHKDWYGKRQEQITAENALRVQFCMSNDELLDYLSDKLIDRINGEWKTATRIAISGFDTWGASCQCNRCRTLGNGSDKTLHFMSYLRKKTDEAIQKGRIDRQIRYVMCSYEGTDTIVPPENPVPQNLCNSGDYIVFYPILRCFQHNFDDESCSYNRAYTTNLENWKDIPIMLGEYYNVSKFEELPLIFSKRIMHDLPYYKKAGATGINYMHLPMVEWGPKTLTQVLFAAYARNTQADGATIQKEYFENLYGLYAKEAEKAYALAEEAGETCTSWRDWGKRSILSDLLSWGGCEMERSLYKDDHLGKDAAQKGYQAAKAYRLAAQIMRDVRNKAEGQLAFDCKICEGVPVNPQEAEKIASKNQLLNRIGCDIRNYRYAADMFEFTALITDYYDTAYRGENTDALWEKITELAHTMNEYTYGVRFNHTKPELWCGDALERSGLKEIYYSIQSTRNKEK